MSTYTDLLRDRLRAGFPGLEKALRPLSYDGLHVLDMGDRARAAGFDDVDEYRQWLRLDGRRQLVLALREEACPSSSAPAGFGSSAAALPFAAVSGTAAGDPPSPTGVTGSHNHSATGEPS